jgi:nucleotide-binding universal stress UspA family protein
MIRRVLVALDGSARAAGVLAVAVEVAMRFDATLVPFRAIQVPSEFPPTAHTSQLDALPSYMQHEAVREVLQLLENADVKSEAPIVREGQPWRAILAAAELQGVDLVVIGSHGYEGVDHILGTTAAKVVNRARRNVLVVHEAGSVRTPDRER